MLKTKKVAKFVLLLNAYWSSRNTAGSPGIFDHNLWFNEAHKTIEHILPQSAPVPQGENKELVDSIGNLTLLPRDVNSYLGDVGWDKRKNIYAVLSATTEKDAVKLCADLSLSKERKKVLLDDWARINSLYGGNYLPTLQKISEYEQFDFSSIKERSKEILGSVWAPLTEWLGKCSYHLSE